MDTSHPAGIDTVSSRRAPNEAKRQHRSPEALTRYAEDGGVEMDNRAAERALRAVALGRKNYLFAGSDAAGERAAALYSLIGTTKLNGLDPESYLRDVLSRKQFFRLPAGYLLR